LIFIPVRTDSPVRRIPWVNHALIAANMLSYLATDLLIDLNGRGEGERVKSVLMLDPQNLELWQFFSYQFLHGDIWHLLGNLLFLWVFGNSVNCKMGQLSYLMFYLACGVFAGVGFAFTSDGPCLGSSGAIAGVTTAFLVLFPRANVTVFYWLWLYVGTVQIQALLLIGFKVILWDNIIAPRLTGGHEFVQVAYAAHIAGYVFGFIWCSLMLLVRAVPRDQYDMLAVARRAYQRQQFRATMADPEAAARALYGRVARPVSAEALATPDDAGERPPDELTRLRWEIAEYLNKRDYAAAAEKYEALSALDPQQVLSRRQMLDIANQLMTMCRYPQAAGAYEKFLTAYPADVEGQQVKLLLGIIYAKYLNQYDAAQKYLRDCLGRLTHPDQLAQAQHWLDAATSALGHGPSPA
jgi:membrane associated rhomboid family serine protease